MSGRRAASGADEDLSPDQSRPALTATAGLVLKLAGSPASPQPALPAPAPRPDTGQDIPARGALHGQRVPHKHVSTGVGTHRTPEEGCSAGDGWMDGRTDGWMDGWMDG